MDKVVILLLLLLFLNSDSTNNNTVDIYENMSNEGMVAMHVVSNQSTTVENTVEPSNPTECKCNGTKTIKTPDGLSTIPCPCDVCKCAKNTGQQVEVKKPKKLAVFFTKTFCPPCIHFKNNDIPALKNVGFTFGDGDTDMVRIINVDSDDYQSVFGVISVAPTFRFYADRTDLNKYHTQYEGYINAHTFSTTWNQVK